MPDCQLRLIPPARPLIERLGRAFFRDIPKGPGVYQMFGRQDALLYVGKAKNLRQRVGSYRYARPGAASRKTVRLVHLVERIAWEQLLSEDDARLRENELLRTLRPKFNRVGTFPRAYFFLEMAAVSGAIQLRLTQVPTAQCYGAFKGQVALAFAAMCRLLWSAVHGYSYEQLPRALVLARPPRSFQIVETGSWSERLHLFLSGEVNLAETLPPGAEETSFCRAFRETDLQLVHAFFENGPRRNRELCRRVGREPGLIAQEELDDLIVRGRGWLDGTPEKATGQKSSLA